MAYKTITEDNIDILVAGAGLGGTGAAFGRQARDEGCLACVQKMSGELAPVG